MMHNVRRNEFCCARIFKRKVCLFCGNLELALRLVSKNPSWAHFELVSMNFTRQVFAMLRVALLTLF